MNIVSWNVNSLKARHDYVAQFLDAEDPDVIVLQELKLQTDHVPTELFSKRGYHLAIHGQKQWNGVLIASKKEISHMQCGVATIEEEQSRVVVATIDGIHFINLYCPQGASEEDAKYQYKLRFFTALKTWLNEKYTPADALMLLGDINIAPRPCDVYWDVQAHPNWVSHHPLELAKFQELIDWGLEDLGARLLPERSYTFYDYRSFWDFKAKRFRYDLGMRIDHFLVSPSVGARAESIEILKSWRHKKNGLKPSDHVPIRLCLNV